eukprot:s4108_g6.t1
MTEYSIESVHWLYQRCTGREERAATSRNPTRLEKYRQLKIYLRIMLNFLHHATPVEYQRAAEMLNMINDLSEDETSPREQEDEGVDLGPVAAATIAAGMTLAGCDADGKAHGEPVLSFQAAVLLGWTMLCCLYTWWMLRAGTWQAKAMQPQPLPTTVLIPEGPQMEELPMPQAEGCVTLTTIRILRRLGRAQRRGNMGQSLKYEQWKRWMTNFIVHLPGTGEERERMVETLRDEHPLSDDDASPLHGMPDDAKRLLIHSSAEIYGHVMGLLEKTTLESAVDLLRLFADAHRAPDPPPGNDDDGDDDDDDESMGPGETESEKRARYLRDPMDECSDPEMWARLNYGPANSDHVLCSKRSDFDLLSCHLFRVNFAVVAMVQQLLLLSTAVVAILGQTDVPTCGALFSIECQNDSAALLQVALVPDTFPLKQMVKPEETRAKTSTGDSGGPLRLAGPKHQHATVMTSMNDWYSSRDLARVWAVQNVAISPKSTVQIFSAVPVFGKDETYIALLVEHNGDAWVDRHRRGSWTHDFDTFVMFCAGPDGSHKTQVIARGLSWVCPWPREEWQTKRFNVFLEDKNGTNFGMVVAEHDPELLGHLVGNMFVFGHVWMYPPQLFIA